MTCCHSFPPHSLSTLDDVLWSLSDLFGTERANKMLELLFERWMMKRSFVFGFERTEPRMPLEICFTPFRFIFFRGVPLELLEGLLIFLWELGLSINRFNAIVLQPFNDNYRPYN